MARKDPAKVPLREFFGKHEDRMKQAHAAQHRERAPQLSALMELLTGTYEPPPFAMSGADWDEFAGWWPMRVLRQAAEEGDSEGCKRLLHLFLLELNIRLPKGVLIPFRWKPGRRDETEAIYKAWVDRGSPDLTGRLCSELANQFCPDEFKKTKSDPSLRKRLRDRIRATIHRHLIRDTFAESAIKASRV
jgi:hypothetical protein